MAKILNIHSSSPQLRLIRQVIDILNAGGVIVYPTDSGYALGCKLGNKKGIDTIRKIRVLDKHHHFTLMVESLSSIGEYARLDKPKFRLLKNILPGPYTFILRAVKDVPNRLLHPKKKTIGFRVSDNNIVRSLVTELAEPIMSVSLILDEVKFYDIDDIKEILFNKVDLIIDGGYCPIDPTTVINLADNNISILRKGAGDISFLS